MKKIFEAWNRGSSQGVVELTFFFHRRGTMLQQTFLGMLRKLLHQLLTGLPSVGGPLQTLCQEKAKWQGPPSNTWKWRIEELKPLFSSVLVEAAKIYRIRLLVDALDEASCGDSANCIQEGRDQTAQDIVSYLRVLNDKFIAQGSAASVCFSCRHFPIIGIKNGLEIVTENHNQIDLADYTYQGLNNRLNIRSEHDEEEIITILQDSIMSRASGVFLWAVLVLPIVASQYNGGHSLETIVENLNAVPNRLHDIYCHILTKEILNTERSKTMLLIAWIYLAKCPLTVTELRFALSSSDDSIRTNQRYLRESKGLYITMIR